MSKLIKKCAVFLLQIAIIFTICIPAAASDDTDIDVVVINPDVKSVVSSGELCSVTIDYQEDVEGVEPVVGAEFTFYRVALLTEEGGYKSIIEGYLDSDFKNDMDVEFLAGVAQHEYAVNPNDDMAAYIAVTNNKGLAVASAIEQGLYVVVETKPVVDHAASLPRLVTLPSTEDGNKWEYNITIKPKSQPLGYLGINKTVTGRSGDTQRDWHFLVMFDDFNSEVPYELTDFGKVTTGHMSSGDVLAIKHGQEIMISNIPVGTYYEVTELEADKDNYHTTVTGQIGYVTRKDAQRAAFVNKNDTPPTGDNYRWLIFAGISVVSLIFIILIIIFIKKNRKNER